MKITPAFLPWSTQTKGIVPQRSFLSAHFSANKPMSGTDTFGAYDDQIKLEDLPNPEPFLTAPKTAGTQADRFCTMMYHYLIEAKTAYPNHKLPGKGEIAARYKIKPIIVRKTFDAFEKIGLLVPLVNGGVKTVSPETFVGKKPEKIYIVPTFSVGEVDLSLLPSAEDVQKIYTKKLGKGRVVYQLLANCIQQNREAWQNKKLPRTELIARRLSPSDEKLKINRTDIHMALLALHRRGLVECRPKGGVKVLPEGSSALHNDKKYDEAWDRMLLYLYDKKLKSGDTVPSSQKLVEMIGCSSRIALKVYQDLEYEGLLDKLELSELNNNPFQSPWRLNRAITESPSKVRKATSLVKKTRAEGNLTNSIDQEGITGTAEKLNVSINTLKKARQKGD